MFKYYTMNIRKVLLPVSPSVGKVTGEYMIPEKPVAILTLAHGAGAGMNHSWMVELATALAEKAGIATLRFNFPFTEYKKGRPDQPAVAHATVAAAIDHARASFPGLALFAGGKSFGGRMTSQYLAGNGARAGEEAARGDGDSRAGGDSRGDVKGIIFYGFPLHPAGKPSIERAEHLKLVTVKMLFLQGTKDELATWDLIVDVCKGLPLATLVKIDGANHAFKAGKRDVIGELVKATADWIGVGGVRVGA
jgi:predicted alpha/beta-hydrolase family hydrolase